VNWFRARHILSDCEGRSVRRRSVLASTAALLGPGVAGCIGESPTTGSPTPSAPQRSERSLSVAFERLQPAVVVLTDAGPRVVGAGHQYLFCRVDATDDDPPDRLSFAFRLGGNTYSPGIESAGRLWRAESESDRYAADSGRGWLVFELPEAWRAEHAALSLRGAEWPVGSVIRQRLAATPSSLSVDWRVEAGEERFAFEVSNDGEHDSWFVATVTEASGGSEESLVSVVEEPIPAGETASWETTAEVAAGGDVGEKTLALSWLGGRLTDTL
jgi:hypothetical protein